jgi:hypothetical protein
MLPPEAAMSIASSSRSGFAKFWVIYRDVLYVEDWMLRENRSDAQAVLFSA